MTDDRAAVVWRQLHWRRPLDPDRVAGLLRQWAADQTSPRLILETRATSAGVAYLLGGRPPVIAAASRLVPQLLPGTTLAADRPERRRLTSAARLRASTRHRPLRPDDPLFVVRAVLSALTQVRGGEELALQLVLGPRRVPLAVPNNSPSSIVAPWWNVALHGDGQTVDGEKRTALRLKVSDHGFACTLRIGVIAATPERRRTLALGLLSAIRTAESAGLQLGTKPETPRHLDVASRPWRWPLRLGVRELVGLLGWPLGDDDLPGQPAAHPKRLPPAPGTTARGIVIGKATAPGVDAELKLDLSAALRHLHALGPTGTGKSTLLTNLIIQDIAAGRSVVVVEPKGDLVADVLARIPERRHHEVVVLDPLDPAPVGLTPFGHAAGGGGRPELIADRMLSLLKSIYGSSIGPRSADILYAALLTLAHRHDASLVMLPLLLTNPGIRRSLTAGIDDPISLGPFWAQFDSWSDGERAAAIAPAMNKLRPLLRPNVRAVLGQRLPKFQIGEVFTRPRIVLAPLQRGQIGPEAARLIGSILISELWQAALARTSVPAEQRTPVSVYIDEAQDFLALGADIGEALAQARGLGVSFTLAHQLMSQLPKELKSGVLANARSRVLFQLGDEDARVMAKGHPELEPRDLTSLGQYEVYASLFAGGQATAYASARTLPPGPATSDPAAIRTLSRDRYGRPLDEIEAGFAALLDDATGDLDDLGILGRRPRRRSI